MKVRVRTTGDVISIEDLHSVLHNVTFPAVLSDSQLSKLGVDRVIETLPPKVRLGYKAVIVGTVKIDGNWQYDWRVQTDDTSIMELKVRLNSQVTRKMYELRSMGVLYNFPDRVKGTVQTRNDTDATNIHSLYSYAKHTLQLREQAGVYEEDRPYYVGDSVIYNNKYYEAIQNSLGTNPDSILKLWKVLPEYLPFRDQENFTHIMTLVELICMTKYVLEELQKFHIISWSIKDQITKARTVEEIQSINSYGWWE